MFFCLQRVKIYWTNTEVLNPKINYPKDKVDNIQALKIQRGHSPSDMTEIFMHKHEWTPNTQASCCFSCNSKFTIVHRRHHCRMCGQIFDSKCCRNYVYPPLFTYLDEKKIRLCDPCYKKAKTYMEQGHISLKKKNLSSIPSVIQRKQELENGLQVLLTTKVYKLSDEVLAHYLTQNQLHKEWYAMLKSIVKETLELITPDTLQEDQININNFIKIKKIPYKDQSLTHLIEGVTIRKNVLHKKMMKDHSNPRILMIKGSLDESVCDDISIMDLHSLDKGKDTFRGILKKIVKMNPQVIITEGSISRIAQEFLLESNKTLVMKVRRHQFKHIARSTKSKPIEDLEDFNHLDQSVLGTCKKFYVTNYQNKSHYQEIKKFKSGNMWDSFDPSLMSFEGSVARNSVTIFISGPDHEQLIKVKQSLREIFHILQILFSERSVISQEIFLFHTKTKLWNLLSQGSNQINFNSSPDIRNLLTIETSYRELITEVSRQACLLNESTVATIGYNLKYCTERTPVSKLMICSNLIFTKLVLVPIDISSFPDLTNMSESAINKLKVSLRNSPRWHQDELCQIEKRPQLVKLRCFEKGDMTLGTYLLNQASKVSEKCLSCHRSFYNHMIFFFTKQYYIKVTLELQDSQKLQQINKDSKKAKIRPSNGRGENIRNKEGFLEYLAHVAPMGAGSGGKKEIISLSPTNNAFDFIAISNSPPSCSSQKKKLHAEMMKDVKMYIECSKCKTKLSERIVLWQSYLECSFIGYLDNMIASADQYGKYFEYNDEGEPESQFLRLIEGLPKDLNVNDCCPFSPKNRVFIVDDLLIKFRVGYSKPYSFSKIDFRSSEALELEKKLNQEIITTKGAKFNELKAGYLKLILNGMKEVFQNMMAQGTLEVNLENMMLTEDLLQGNNGESLLSAKEPGCTMFLDLIPIYKNVLKLMAEVENEPNNIPTNHLELEFSRQTFLEKISELSDLLYKIHQNQEKIKAEAKAEAKEQSKKKKKNKMKETQSSDEYMNNSKSMQAEVTEFTLEENSSPSKLCAEEDEVSVTDQRNLSQEISEITSNQTTSYDYDIEQEINYLQKLFAGIPFYPEDLELNQFVKYKTMPVYNEDQPLSAIAFALNSAQYLKEVFIKEEFDSENSNSRSFLENKLCMDETQMNKNFSFKFAPNPLEVKCFDRLTIALSGKSGKQAVKRKKTVSRDLIDDISRFIDIGAKKSLNHIIYSEKIAFPSFQISIYYPAQFEALRLLEGLPLADYLLSLACSQNWDDNSGGKTGASFIKTYDQKFVFKQLDKKEFSMLLGFTPKYLKYMSNSKKQPSLLCKIYGIYEIQYEKKTKYLIAMENMFFGLGKGVKVYDLKGSELNRYAGKKNEEDAGTLLDTNYRVDRNGEPLPIKSECHEFIDQGIKEDTEFLAGLKVVDYSLLLILDEKNKVTRMGIIDYLRIYDLEKQLEHVGKKFITGGTTPTITGPDDYKNRFQKAMSKYFMEINTT